MSIKEITNQHLLNRIKFFERRLSEKPTLQIYMGDSEYGYSWVEQENRQNDEIESKIKNHIAYMKREARARGLHEQFEKGKK